MDFVEDGGCGGSAMSSDPCEAGGGGMGGGGMGGGGMDGGQPGGDAFGMSGSGAGVRFSIFL